MVIIQKQEKKLKKKRKNEMITVNGHETNNGEDHAVENDTNLVLNLAKNKLNEEKNQLPKVFLDNFKPIIQTTDANPFDLLSDNLIRFESIRRKSLTDQQDTEPYPPAMPPVPSLPLLTINKQPQSSSPRSTSPSLESPTDDEHKNLGRRGSRTPLINLPHILETPDEEDKGFAMFIQRRLSKVGY